MEEFFLGVREEGKGEAVGDRVLSVSHSLIPSGNHPKALPWPCAKKSYKNNKYREYILHPVPLV